MRRVVAGVGRVMMATGALLLLFVVYQLWGTGVAESRAQDDLRDDFRAALVAPVSTEGTRVDAPGATTTVPPAPPPAPEGEAVALIRIPDIGVDKAVVSGVGVPDLKKGPGHYPDTPLPGQPGHAAIAGHRTTYGAPFFRLDEVEVGDTIEVTTRQGDFRYQVDRSTIVSPKAVEVLDPTPEARLTLTTCNPRYSARQRLVVSAVLVDEPAAAPPALARGEGGPEAPAAPVALDDEAGLSGDPSARTPALLWGGVAALVALITWALGRAWMRLPAYLLGLPVFAVVLFVFFENVARLFPANV